MKITTKSIGKQIRQWRRNQRPYADNSYLSLPTLANDAGITKATLSKIENGKGNPCLSTLCKLAKAMYVTFEI